MHILETGAIENEQRLEEIVSGLAERGVRNGVVAKGSCSHYWLVEYSDDTDDHKHVIYLGTPATFDLWLKRLIQ